MTLDHPSAGGLFFWHSSPPLPLASFKVSRVAALAALRMARCGALHLSPLGLIFQAQQSLWSM
jgi:hypothetical protein